MKKFLYRSIIILSKIFGLWVFIMFAWIISTGFFLFFPSRVAISVRFYQALFPNRSWTYHIWCTWRQYHNFIYIFLDRFLLQDFGDISYTSEGWEYLEEAVKNKTGGIILMSHMGNWEIAAHLLKRKLEGIRLLLYMGIRHKEQIERMQKDSLSHSGIRIIALNQDGGSPFDIVEGLEFLKEGGLVSLAGDIIWSGDQRIIPVRFLDHEVYLPETPHIFALLSGVPLFIFFSFRTGKKHYHCTITKPKYVKAASRFERKEVIRRSAQEYADVLDQTLRQYPLQWYHFEPFLGKRLK